MTARIVSQFHRCSAGWVAAVLAVALLAGAPAAARAGGLCTPPSIDGSLQDMIDFANCPDLVGCGLVQSDDSQDVCADDSFDPCQNGLIIPCPAAPQAALGTQIYYPNGADLTLVVGAYDAVADVLYLGTRTVFAIGDADGDNDPGVNPANCDGTNITEQPGIGPQESYNFFIDTDCNGVPDITVEVSDNDVTVSQSVSATSLSFNGTDLEVSVTGLGLPAVFCLQGFSGFTFDGLAEDQSLSICCPPPTPNILVELDCPGTLCPGASGEITATVTNMGTTALSGVTLTIPLPASLNFTAFVNEDGWDSCAEAAGTITCTESSLELFGVRVVAFSVTAKPDCEGTNTVPATASGTFTQPGCVEESGAFDDTSCDIACSLPPCSIEGDNTICTGETTEFCAPAGQASYAWTGPGGFTATSQCITVGTAGEYCVTITDANGCSSTCCRTLTVNPPPPCSITGDDTICEGETTEFCAPAGLASYSWTGPGGFTATSQCITVGVDGEYCVTVTDANGCESNCCQTLTVEVCGGGCCWMTSGGFLNAGFRSGNKDHNFGGNVGPPPAGSWQHVVRQNNRPVFNFHSHDVEVIACFDTGQPDPCNPAGIADSIVFGGPGAYSDGSGPRDNEAYFVAFVADNGEPGRRGDQQGGCGYPDYYGITVYDAGTDAVVFTIEGVLDGGNLQVRDCQNALNIPAFRAAVEEYNRQYTIYANKPVEEYFAFLASGSTDVSPGASNLELFKPMPNPFTQTVQMAYSVGEGAAVGVEISVYNASGQRVRTLVAAQQPPGRYDVVWDGRDDSGKSVPGGVYFYRSKVGEESTVSRVIYMR